MVPYSWSMPFLSSLAVYVVRVRNANRRKKETLSAMLGEHDLLEVLKTYFAEIKRESPDNEGSRLILRVLKCVEDDRSFIGTIETGEYGIDSVLVHRKTKQEVYKRTRDVADMWPFFFYFFIPNGTDEGVLIIQRRGNYGVRSVLYNLLAPRLEKQFGELRLRVEPLVLDKDFRKLMKAKATQVRYVRYNRSSDIADSAESGYEEKYGTATLTFKAKRGRFFNVTQKLKDVLNGEPANEVFALEDNEFLFDKVKVHLEQEGRPRQVDLNNLKNVRSYHNITAKLEEMGKTPNDFEALKTLAAELLREIRTQVYGRAGAS
jgi:hypothetical protein